MNANWKRPENVKHGTIYGYRRQGCRCAECRRASAVYQGAYRARKRASA